VTTQEKKRVLVTDKLDEEGLRILREADGLEVEVKTGLPPDELRALIGDYHALAVRSGTKVTADILEVATRLEVIGRAGIGVDNVDVEAASRLGVVVMNTPEGSAVTTAEHALALLMALARRIAQATASMRGGRWEKKKFMGTELAGKTLGVLGIGNIGAIVADRAQGLKMKVIAHDPYISPEMAEKKGIELVGMDELLARSDFITIHTPLTKDTKHLINKQAFEKMKDGVLIVNAARGGIIHEGDLYDAVKSGKVAGAAMDVWEKEPPGEHPLTTLDQVICTPHLGASTGEAQVNVSVAVAQQLVAFLTTGTIKNAVNVPSVSRELMAQIEPYLILAERLGSFLGQTFEGGIEEFHIEYCGQVGELESLTPVTVAGLKGLLAPMLGDKVNFVNAPFLAKERGIHLVESKTSEARDFASLIAMRAAGKGRERRVSGTLFGRRSPRIVRIDDFELEAHAGGHIIVMHNKDKPGVVGAVGSLLGSNGINIARMQLGLDYGKHEAVALIQVDERVPESVLEKFAALQNVIWVKQIEL
jgi:D-3-phosphoglycerate dehydrogenase